MGSRSQPGGGVLLVLHVLAATSLLLAPVASAAEAGEDLLLRHHVNAEMRCECTTPVNNATVPPSCAAAAAEPSIDGECCTWLNLDKKNFNCHHQCHHSLLVADGGGDGGPLFRISCKTEAEHNKGAAFWKLFAAFFLGVPLACLGVAYVQKKGPFEPVALKGSGTLVGTAGIDLMTVPWGPPWGPSSSPPPPIPLFDFLLRFAFARPGLG
eukprot:SAG22_NODE_890_length_6647_cov_68.631185_4_plen_211_part_00